MMKAGAAESAPLLQKLDETNETPKPGAIAAAARHKLPTGEVIMRGPSGALEPGKTTAIMGASGAGKTTIMNLITGIARVEILEAKSVGRRPAAAERRGQVQG